jgi:hypothetical protein
MRVATLVVAAAGCACGSSASSQEPPPPAHRDAGPAPALPIPSPAFEAPPPTDRIVDLAEGPTWACATRESGHVECWSDKVERLPDIDDALAVRGTQFERCILRRSEITCFHLGIDPEPPTHHHVANAIALSVGYPDCVIRADHRVACWSDKDAPKLVPNLRDVVAITGNGYVTCAVHGDGKVSCVDDLSARYPWRRVSGLHDVKLLAIGEGGGDNGDFYSNGCAVLATGELSCFQASGHTGGPISSGSVDTPLPPATLAALRGASAIVFDGESNQLEAIVDGKVLIAAGSAPLRTLPKLGDAVALTPGCALRRQGTVVCWGDKNTAQPALARADHPVPVVGVADVVSLAVGQRTVWAVTRDGHVYHWGEGEAGWAVPLDGAHDAKAVMIGRSVIDLPCFLRSDAGVTCLGYRNHLPTDLQIAHVAELIETDDNLVRTVDGRLFTWMNIEVGEPTFGTSEIPAIPGAVEQRGSMAMVCGRDASGAVRCMEPECKWVSVGRWHCSPGAIRTIAIPPASELAMTRSTACAIVDNGKVSCWGRNDFGELGRGSADNQVSPPGFVTGIVHAVAIRATEIAFCAEEADGSLACWGTRDWDKKLRHVLPPGSLDGPFAGGADGCAIRRDGLVACWGDNSYGRLGDGSILRLDSPAAVPGLH